MPTADVVMIPGYTEVDLRAGVNVGRFTVQAFARNLFNKRGITIGVRFLVRATSRTGQPASAIIRPRTIGLTLTASFDRSARRGKHRRCSQGNGRWAGQRA